MPPGSLLLERPGDIHYRRPTGSGGDEEDSYNGCLVNGVGSGFFKGRLVNGTWPPTLHQAHINYLELLAVFLALRHFLPLLGKCHVLVRADNTTAVAYINREGGTRSVKLHRLAQSLLLWSSKHLLSLRTAHIPGTLKSGVDLLSRGNPLYGEWRLNSEVLLRVWERFSRASVDLFASHENAQCPLFFSLRCTGAPVVKRAAVCFSPTLPHHSDSDQSKGAAAITNPDSSLLAQQTVDGGADAAHPRPAMAVAITHGLGVTGAWADFSSAPRMAGSLGLVRERVNLHETGLPTRVIETIQCMRAPSMRSLYDNKWRV